MPLGAIVIATRCSISIIGHILFIRAFPEGEFFVSLVTAYVSFSRKQEVVFLSFSFPLMKTGVFMKAGGKIFNIDEIC